VRVSSISMPPSKIFICACAFIASFLASAYATYSIAACESGTGQCGVAVQTDNLAVGSSVPFAQAGVGAIASQFETNPLYGPHGLALLASGNAPVDVLRSLLAEDGGFEGQGIEARQVAVVGLDGRSAVHTGSDAMKANWAGSRSGPGYSVQGNGLAGPQVLEAMQHAFLESKGPLAERMVASLVAGDKAGGQRTGRESAALIVRTREGYPFDIDLRVDDAADPVGELRRLYGLQAARQMIIQARIDGEHGKRDEARHLLIAAVSRASNWPRGCVDAARVAIDLEEPDLALQYLALGFERSPTRIPIVIGDGTFASLGSDPAFHQWIDSDMESRVLDDERQIAVNVAATVDERLELGARLLEVGRPKEALNQIDRVLATKASVQGSLLRVSALSALGRVAEAIVECRDSLKRNPGDFRLRLRLTMLLSAAS
jgi:uncharacterized Ntn-hydrolase superfamily protein